MGQSVQQVSQAHQVMIALHGVPIVREAMFILVAVMLFLQDVVLDLPPVTAHLVTAPDYVLVGQGLAGKPDKAGGNGDYRPGL